MSAAAARSAHWRPSYSCTSVAGDAGPLGDRAVCPTEPVASRAAVIAHFSGRDELLTGVVVLVIDFRFPRLLPGRCGKPVRDAEYTGDSGRCGDDDTDADEADDDRD